MVFTECAPRGRGAGKCGVRNNPFSAPRGRGARPIHFVFLSRRCPAFAGLRLAIFVVNAETVSIDNGVGNPSEGAAKILPKIGRKTGVTE